MAGKTYLYRMQFDSNAKSEFKNASQAAKVAERHFNVTSSAGQKGFYTLTQAVNKSNAEVLKETKNVAKLGNEFRKIPHNKTINVKTPGLTNANRQLGMMQNRMMGVLRNAALMAGLTFGAAGLANGTVGNQAVFEKSLSNVQALTQSTTKDMTLLRVAAQNAGETTAYTAKQSADSMGYLAMAGQTNTQIMRSLGGVLDLAAAGSIDLARSADIATNIMSQYGMKASDTASMVDKLAFTQSKANTNVYEMADAMNYFGPTAKAMDISLSESLGTIGILANNGLKGSLATRALGTSISRLAKPTKQAQAAMDKYNLTFFDAQGNFIGMAGMVQQLETKLANLTPQQRLAALTAIYQSEALQEVNILLSAGSKKLREFTGEIEKSEGAAKRMAQVKLDNLAGDITKLNSVSESFGISLGAELAPMLRQMTQITTLWVRSLDTKEVGMHMRQTTMTVWKLVNAVYDNWGLIKNLAKGYFILRGAIYAYNLGVRIQAGLTAANTVSLSLMRGGLISATAATEGATVATNTLNTAVKFSPIGAAISVVTALAGAYLLLRDNINSANDANNTFELDRQRDDWEKKEFNSKVAETKTLTNLVKDESLLNAMSDHAIQQKVQQAEMMRDYFSNLQATSRQYFQAAQDTGFINLDWERKQLESEKAQIQHDKDLIQSKIASSKSGFVSEKDIAELASLNTKYGEVENKLAGINTQLLKIREDHPELTNAPESTTAQATGYLTQINDALKNLRNKLPSDNQLISATSLSQNNELGSAVNNELNGSAVGGVRAVTVNMNFGDINNTVNSGEVLGGIDRVIDETMERLLRALNEAGLQAKVALSR